MSALTPAEARYAGEHHQLVFSFLNRNGLDERDYYDVAVFGYLAAVKRYLKSKSLRRYRFSTIAWRSMMSSVSKDLRAKEAERRALPSISLEASTDQDHSIETWLSVRSDALLAFEVSLLMQELSQRVSKKQMEIVQLRIMGCSVSAIAKALRIPACKVSAALSELYDVVMDVCYG